MTLSRSFAPPADQRLSLREFELRHTRWTRSTLFVMVLLTRFLLVRLALSVPLPTDTDKENFMPVTPQIPLPDSIKHDWGPYTPYFSHSQYSKPTAGCRVTQVNLLQRHGARFPTSGSGENIQTAVEKLQSAPSFEDPRLNFLRNFTYNLGTDDLFPFGASQSFDSGRIDFLRYGELLSSNDLPFVRASSKARVVDSATNWTAGFSRESDERLQPSLNVILQESSNDTLDDNMCPNAGTSDAQTGIWQSMYAAPIADRLNAAAPGANITTSDVTNLISLCPFDTLFKETPSPFCDLFNQTEFDGFEYFNDLEKFYGTGYGQPLGPVQGVGYVNELLARLTQSPVRDQTQTNRTLDNNQSTFPLNRTFYADFSHDDEMIAIYSAIGLLRPRAPLDPTLPDPERIWIASDIISFSARLVTERVECGEQVFVRMFVNDARQDMGFCGAGVGLNLNLDGGMCELDTFVRSQLFARSNGDGLFEKCFV